MLRAEDIAMTKFAQAKKGYNPDEVDEFIRKMIQNVEESELKISEYESRIAEFNSIIIDNQNQIAKLSQEGQVMQEDLVRISGEYQILKGEYEKLNGEKEAVQETLESARVVSADLSSAVEKKAELIIANAKLEAEALVKKANDEVEEIMHLSSNMTDKFNNFAVRYRQVLKDELARFESTVALMFPDIEEGKVKKGKELIEIHKNLEVEAKKIIEDPEYINKLRDDKAEKKEETESDILTKETSEAEIIVEKQPAIEEPVNEETVLEKTNEEPKQVHEEVLQPSVRDLSHIEKEVFGERKYMSEQLDEQLAKQELDGLFRDVIKEEPVEKFVEERKEVSLNDTVIEQQEKEFEGFAADLGDRAPEKTIENFKGFDTSSSEYAPVKEVEDFDGFVNRNDTKEDNPYFNNEDSFENFLNKLRKEKKEMDDRQTIEQEKENDFLEELMKETAPTKSKFETLSSDYDREKFNNFKKQVNLGKK